MAIGHWHHFGHDPDKIAHTHKYKKKKKKEERRKKKKEERRIHHPSIGYTFLYTPPVHILPGIMKRRRLGVFT